MRKMKKLFKIRKRFIPWHYWSIITLVLNSISLVALFITSCFSNSPITTSYLMPWLWISVVPIGGVFLVQLFGLFLMKNISKNVLEIISRKLENINKQDIKLKINNCKYYSCLIDVYSNQYTKEQLIDTFTPIYKELNKKFGHNLHVVFSYNQNKQQF